MSIRNDLYNAYVDCIYSYSGMDDPNIGIRVIPDTSLSTTASPSFSSPLSTFSASPSSNPHTTHSPTNFTRTTQVMESSNPSMHKNFHNNFTKPLYTLHYRNTVFPRNLVAPRNPIALKMLPYVFANSPHP